MALSISEKMKMAFSKKNLPKLKFIFYIERENGLVVYIKDGYRIGEQYLIRDKKENITWRLGLPPNKAIMQSGNKGVGGVVHVYVPDRDIFLYLTDIKPRKDGKYVFEAMVDGKKKKIIIEKPVAIVPKISITDVEMKKLSQEAMMRRLYVEETELTRKQKEAMMSMLQKWAPIIATGVLVVFVIIAIYAGVGAWRQVAQTATQQITQILKAVPKELAKNATAGAPNW